MLGDIVKEVLENYDYRIMSHQKQKQALEELQQMQDRIKELEEKLKIQTNNVVELQKERGFWASQLEQQKEYVELGKAVLLSNSKDKFYIYDNNGDMCSRFELMEWYREQKRQKNA